MVFHLCMETVQLRNGEPENFFKYSPLYDSSGGKKKKKSTNLIKQVYDMGRKQKNFWTILFLTLTSAVYQLQVQQFGLSDIPEVWYPHTEQMCLKHECMLDPTAKLVFATEVFPKHSWEIFCL